MGHGTPGELHAKRVYSLAYNRALGRLKRAHEEEFHEFLNAEQMEIIIQDQVEGEIYTAGRGGLRHVASLVDPDVCEECGNKVPCRAMRRRETGADRR